MDKSKVADLVLCGVDTWYELGPDADKFAIRVSNDCEGDLQLVSFHSERFEPALIVLDVQNARSLASFLRALFGEIDART